MREDIDLYITRDRLEKASFRRKLNPIAKNVSKRQNSIKLVFKEVSTFVVQNLVTGYFMEERDVWNNNLASKLVRKPPKPIDAELQSRFKALKDFYKNWYKLPPNTSNKFFYLIFPILTLIKMYKIANVLILVWI